MQSKREIENNLILQNQLGWSGVFFKCLIPVFHIKALVIPVFLCEIPIFQLYLNT